MCLGWCCCSPDCLGHFPIWPRARGGHEAPRGSFRGLVDIIKVILKNISSKFGLKTFRACVDFGDNFHSLHFQFHLFSVYAN